MVDTADDREVAAVGTLKSEFDEATWKTLR